MIYCQLCRDREAELMATVPMCGSRPRYSLCPECVSEIDAYAEDVEPLGRATTDDEGSE